MMDMQHIPELSKEFAHLPVTPVVLVVPVYRFLRRQEPRELAIPLGPRKVAQTVPDVDEVNVGPDPVHGPLHNNVRFHRLPARNVSLGRVLVVPVEDNGIQRLVREHAFTVRTRRLEAVAPVREHVVHRGAPVEDMFARRRLETRVADDAAEELTQHAVALHDDPFPTQARVHLVRGEVMKRASLLLRGAGIVRVPQVADPASRRVPVEHLLEVARVRKFSRRDFVAMDALCLAGAPDGARETALELVCGRRAQARERTDAERVCAQAVFPAVLWQNSENVWRRIRDYEVCVCRAG